jgi:hypothetical protein
MQQPFREEIRVPGALSANMDERAGGRVTRQGSPVTASAFTSSARYSPW